MARILMPLMAVLLLSMTAQAQYYFGTEGRDGQAGRDGRDGQSGDNKVIFAQGQSASLEAAGLGGEGAGDGYEGESAMNCYQPKPEYNIRGAPGGNGGQGGDGGSGGNGGNVMVYAQDLSMVKKITVDARPGRGGRGGWGARGGYGCRCQVGSWTLKKCWQEKDKDGKPVTVCGNQTYYCEGGQTGQDGRAGYRGADGKMGTLFLVNSLTELPPEMTKAKIYMGDILKSAVKLSDNIWKVRSGASQLFGAGSFIADNYNMFDRRIEVTTAFDWKVNRPLDLFASELLQLELKGEEVALILPKEIWYQTSQALDGNRATVRFEKMLRESEVTQLAAKATGSGSGLTFEVIDNAKVSDMVTTTFHLKYKTDGFFNKTRYEGPISSQVIATGAQNFSLQIGKLPIKSEYLKVGQGIKVELTVKRSLNGKSKTQQIKFDHKIGQ